VSTPTDRAFPVVAQISRSTGNLEALFWWPMSPHHRGRNASNALLLRGDELWVSAPSSGGLVRIDLASGGVTTIALEATPGPLVAGDAVVWVLGDADWKDDEDDESEEEEEHQGRYLASDDGAQDGDRVRRPIIWAEPAIDPFPPWLVPDAEDIDEGQAEPFDDDEDDFGWDTPRPVWQVEGGSAVRVDFGGDVSRLVPLAGGEVLVVLRRSDDAIVKTPRGMGSVSFTYPGVLARRSPQGEFAVLADLPDTGGSLFVERDRCWVSGFGLPDREPESRGSSIFGSDPVAFYELDLQTGDLIEATAAAEPNAIVEGVAIVIDRDRASPLGGRVVRCEAECIDLNEPSRRFRAELPAVVEPFGVVLVADGQVWFVSDVADALVWLDPRSGATGTIAITAEIDGAPEPVAPTGLDLSDYERHELDGLRACFFGGWTDAAGVVAPFIQGIEFDAVELRGQFPESHVVAWFRARDRPGTLFARRWDLYDELGNPTDLEDADISLMEDIEAAGWGLPPLDHCLADAEGIVWF